MGVTVQKSDANATKIKTGSYYVFIAYWRQNYVPGYTQLQSGEGRKKNDLFNNSDHVASIFHFNIAINVPTDRSINLVQIVKFALYIKFFLREQLTSLLFTKYMQFRNKRPNLAFISHLTNSNKPHR